jgi:hypothetical protein
MPPSFTSDPLLSFASSVFPLPRPTLSPCASSPIPSHNPERSKKPKPSDQSKQDSVVFQPISRQPTEFPLRLWPHPVFQRFSSVRALNQLCCWEGSNIYRSRSELPQDEQVVEGGLWERTRTPMAGHQGSSHCRHGGGSLPPDSALDSCQTPARRGGYKVFTNGKQQHGSTTGDRHMI